MGDIRHSLLTAFNPLYRNREPLRAVSWFAVLFFFFFFFFAKLGVNGERCGQVDKTVPVSWVVDVGLPVVVSVTAAQDADRGRLLPQSQSSETYRDVGGRSSLPQPENIHV